MSLKQGPVDPETLRIEPCLLDETVNDTSERLRAAGFKIADSDDLFEFATKRPGEMCRWFRVMAYRLYSNWSTGDGWHSTAFAGVYTKDGAKLHTVYRIGLNPNHGVLVHVQKKET